MQDDDAPKPRGFKPGFTYIQPKKSGTSLVVGPEGIFRYADAKMETLADAVDVFWAAVAHDPAGAGIRLSAR